MFDHLGINWYFMGELAVSGFHLVQGSGVFT